MSMTLREYRDSRKAKYAWPGGYPLFYVMTDGGALCHDCGRTEWRTIVSAWNDPWSDWRPESVQINWEDSKLYCDHCGNRIESAYAEPEV